MPVVLQPVDPQGLSPAAEGLLPGDYREGELFEGTDLRGSPPSGCELFECVWDRVQLGDALVDRLSLVECRLQGLDEPVLRLPGSRWRDVEVSDTRLGSVEAHGADWQRVLLRGCRIGYLNLRGSSIEEIIVRDCQIDELDLVDVKATRVQVENTRIDSLVVRQGRLREFDLRGAELATLDGIEHLRGAMVTAEQLIRLAPALAAHHGIVVGQEE